jgi:anti-anti-sigma regulatory factor
VNQSRHVNPLSGKAGEKIMQFEFTNCEDFLIIKLSGTTSPNERLLSKQSLVSQLQKPHLKVIVDLSELREHGGAYLMGMLNMIRKEIQILRGEMKLCALSWRLYRYFQENRLLDLFETKRTIEQAKRSFRKEKYEDKS